MEKEQHEPAPEIVARARQILGLTNLEREPRALPVRAEQLWRAERFARNVPYTGSFLVPLGHAPDLAVIRQAVAAVVARHEALRSRLMIAQGMPILIPAATEDFAVTEVARADIVAYGEGRAAGALSDFFSAPIDLFEQSGFRCRAFADEKGDVSLGVLMHHYFGDAWSSQVLRRELEEAFAGKPLGDVPAQYSDYALFQRRSLDKNLTQKLAFWHGWLKDAPATSLPFDGADDGAFLGRLFFLIEEDVLRPPVQMSRKQRISLGVICFAAFQLALARWCGVDRIVSGVIAANRIRPQFRGTVGYLLSAIPLFSRLAPAMALNEFLSGLARDFYDGIGQQDISAEHYDEIFAPAAPFCTPRFNFTPRQEAFAADREQPLPAIKAVHRASDVRRNSAYPDLHFLLVEYPQGMVGRIIHSKRLSLENLSALIAIYKEILRRMAADREARLDTFL